MALYGVSTTNGQLISATQASADCSVTCSVPGTPVQSFQLSTTVVVAVGTVAAMNVAILAAGVAEIQRVYSIAVNAGGADQKGLFGGRTI